MNILLWKSSNPRQKEREGGVGERGGSGEGGSGGGGLREKIETQLNRLHVI